MNPEAGRACGRAPAPPLSVLHGWPVHGGRFTSRTGLSRICCPCVPPGGCSATIAAVSIASILLIAFKERRSTSDDDHDHDYDDNTMELQYQHHSYEDANGLIDGHHDNDQSNGSPSLLAAELNVQQLLHGGVPINSTSYNTIVRINDNLTTATTSYNQIASLGNHYNPTNSNSMGTSNDISLLLPPALLDAQTQTRLVVDSSSDYNINITNTSIKYNHSNDINYMGSKYIHNNTELQGVPTPNHHHHHNSNEMHSLLQMLGYIKY